MSRHELALACLLLSPGCAGACPEPAPTSPTLEQTEQVVTATSEPGPIAAACDVDVHRRFDFWLGHWVVHTADGTVAGHNHIERAHAGCAVLEHWASASGGSGTSTNYFDPGNQAWVQNWIDASGSVIQLEGDLVDGAMVLEGRYVQADGTTQQMRGTWTALDDGRVRQHFETSADGGETWVTWFEGFYTRE